MDAIDIYDWAMSQSLPHDEIKFGTCIVLEELLNTFDDSDIGFLKS